MTGTIREERDGIVARLILSRPPHNFFDADMLSELADRLEAIDASPDIRVTLLASDQRSFCAGADFGGGARPDPQPIYAAATRLAGRRKPLVAAVGGAAVGGGLGLAMLADLRVGDETTRFEANFVRIGLSAGFGLSHTLMRTIGAQKARDLLLTGRSVAADEALDIGLLDRFAPRGALIEVAMSLALRLAANSPAALWTTRRLIADVDQVSFEAAVARELEHQRPLFAAPDFDEGVSAMRERRSAAFADLAFSPASGAEQVTR